MNASEGSTTPPADHHGFFCADRPNSELNQRYKLVGKLGEGRRSSVWLAEDIYPQKWRRSRFVAIKILSAQATQAQSIICDEIFMIRHVKKRLAARGPLHPAQKQFTVYLGNFIINDDLGVHLCLAMEPLVNFWAAIRGPYKAISVALAKDATRQLLAALCFLHEECGVVHRDLRPENLLVSLTYGDMSLARHDAEFHKASRPGQPPSTPMAVLGGVPLSVPSDPSDYFRVDDPSEKLIHNIKLTGFGSAIIKDSLSSSQPFMRSNTMSAPEIILGNQPTFGTDIWSLGCLVYELLTGCPLFCPIDTENHLLMMPQIAEEEFETPYIREGRHYTEYFDAISNTPHSEAEESRNITDHLRFHSWIDWKGQNDKDAFISFFLFMMHLHPWDRGTAAELLEDRWLQS